MIKNVSFSGRETMLTLPAKKAVSKFHEYVSASKVYSPAEIAEAQKLAKTAKLADNTSDALSKNYANPYSPIFSRPAELQKTVKVDDETLAKHINYFG